MFIFHFYIIDISISLYGGVFIVSSSKQVVNQDQRMTIHWSMKEVPGLPDGEFVQRLFQFECF